MKKSNLLILLLLIFSFQVKVAAQNAIDGTNASIVPMSPNASALAMYADYPVSYYTGVPNINIPLYEINVDGFKLPISLSYHADGIKVSQEASWVGLGWALNAGGAISRTIKCVDDFLEYPSSVGYITEGYYASPDMTYRYDVFDHYIGSVPYTNRTYFTADGSLFVDSQPDLFYYSLPGTSGKFVLDKSRGAVLFDKSQNLRIEVVTDKTNSYFKDFIITTSDGIQYIFDQHEKSTYISSPGYLNQNYTKGPSDNDTGDFMEPHSNEYTSSWYLSKIITTNKKEISFAYAPEYYQSPTQESSKTTNALDKPTYSQEITVSKSIQENLRLSSITWNDGSVIFSASGRDDMNELQDESTKPEKLDKIRIYDNNNTLIKGFNFSYDYFNKDYVDNNDFDNKYIDKNKFLYVYKRLKLNSVTEVGRDNSVINKGTSFNYITGDLPAKNSKNTDYWGYNNGANYGANYVMGFSTNDGTFNHGFNFGGTTRTGNFNFLKIGTLSSIHYPTGDSCVFTYEANSFPNGSFGQPQTPLPADYITVLNSYQPYPTNPIDFGDYAQSPPTATDTIYGAHSIQIMANINNDFIEAPNYTDPNYTYDDTNYPIGYLEEINPDGTVKKIFIPIPMMSIFNGQLRYGEDQVLFQGTGVACNMETYVIDGGVNIQVNASGAGPGDTMQDGTILVQYNGLTEIPLDPNKRYVFVANKPPIDMYIDWNLTVIGNSSFKDNYVKSSNTTYTPPIGGGLRIAQIKAGNKTRNFDYNNSGLLLLAPFLAYWYSHSDLSYLVQLSEPLLSLTTITNGNSVGYSDVKETVTDGVKTAMTEYLYNNEVEDDGTSIPDYPFYPPPTNYTNGLVNQINYYTDNTLVKTVDYQYNSYFSQKINGFAYYPFLVPNNNQYLYQSSFATDFYIEWPLKKTETTTDYVTNPNQSIIKTHNYSYNTSPLFNYTYNPNPLLFVSDSTVVDNSSYVKKTFYPTDFNNAVSRAMVARNMVGTPVESLELKDGKVISGQKTQYLQTPNGLILPQIVNSLNTIAPLDKNTYSNAYSPKVFYDLYNNYGKVMQLHTLSSQSTYLWSYDYQYPIAEIKNASLADVKTALGYDDTQIETLAANNAPDVSTIRTKLTDYFKDKTAQVTTYTYKPLVGMLTATDPRGVTTYYDYDNFNRLIDSYIIEDGVKKIVQSNAYHYQNQ